MSSSGATFVDTFTLARRLTGNEEDGRDVVQDAYLRAWRGHQASSGATPQFSTWMYRITANARRDQRASAAAASRPIRSRTISSPPTSAPISSPRAMAESAEALERISRRPRRAAAEAAQRRGAEGRLRPLARGDRRRARHHGRRGEGPAAPWPAQAPRRVVRRRSRELMLCDEVTDAAAGNGRRRPRRRQRRRAPHRDVPALPGRARALPPAAAHALAAAHPLRGADARACSARPSPRSPTRPKRAPGARCSRAGASRTRAPSAEPRSRPAHRGAADRALPQALLALAG